MAKCVVCKADNASKEAERHPNAVTLATATLLWKRVKATSRKLNPNRYCEKHLQATPILKEEENSNAQL